MDSERPSYVCPMDLHSAPDPDEEYLYHGSVPDMFPDAPEQPSFSRQMTAVDSAVDLTRWTGTPAEPAVPFEEFVYMGESPATISSTINSPSPGTDMLFSNSNSPGDFTEQSPVSPPDTPSTLTVNAWNSYTTPSAIAMPQRPRTPTVTFLADKLKTRAETQVKVTVILDPLESADHIRFPRELLAKPKHYVSEEDERDFESKGSVIRMTCLLLCATAVEKPEQVQRAFRRARGEEQVPKRSIKVPVTELDKDDLAHPQNGGEVIICEGCKERERKRYDRKKKRSEDEDEYWSYEDRRALTINDNEIKKLKEVDPNNANQFSPQAKQVDIALRICCYCRHQEEKTPQGYRVVFTFIDAQNNVLAQELSPIFHITDDHKNRETTTEQMPRTNIVAQSYVAVPTAAVPAGQYMHTSSVPVQMHFPYTPVEPQYPPNIGPYTQPPTPVVSNFQHPISPMDVSFPSASTARPLPPVRQTAAAYSPTIAAPNPGFQYARTQRGQAFYETPMLNTMVQSNTMVQMPMHPRQGAPLQTQAPHTPSDVLGSQPQALAQPPTFEQTLQRHNSVDVTANQMGLPSPSPPIHAPSTTLSRAHSEGNIANLNYYSMDAQGQSTYDQYAFSQPPSAAATPLNLSRPASPTWEQQGASKKGKTVRCVYYVVDE